jgi:L-fuconolactonase
MFELPAIFPRHLGDVPALAQMFPTLTIVIDHLGKPPLDGEERLLCGCDWPVTLLNGDYGRVWTETRRTLDAVAPHDQDQMLHGTACRLYRLAEVPVGAH